MARLRYLNREDLSEENKDLLDRPINLNRLLVHSPNCRRAGLAMANFLRFKSRLDPRLRELAILAVGYLVRAPYEWSHHIKLGAQFGVTRKDVAELIRTLEGQPGDLGAEALTVIQAAREMTEDGGIGTATFAALQGFLDEERLVDLVVLLAHYNGIVRVLRTMEVDVEDDYKAALEEFPLPA